MKDLHMKKKILLCDWSSRSEQFPEDLRSVREGKPVFSSHGLKRGWKICRYAIQYLVPVGQEREESLVVYFVIFNKFSGSTVVRAIQ